MEGTEAASDATSIVKFSHLYERSLCGILNRIASMDQYQSATGEASHKKAAAPDSPYKSEAANSESLSRICVKTSDLPNKQKDKLLFELFDLLLRNHD